MSTTVHSTRSIPAFAYLRMSSDQQEASPAQQRAEIEKLAKRLGYRIVRWFVDEGITGNSIEEREEFTAMLKAAAAGDVKAILVWNQNRFSRMNPFKVCAVVAPLIDAGIKLVSVANQGALDWDDFAGQMMFLMNAGSDHKFLKDLSRDVTRGKIAGIPGGSFLPMAPFGMCRIFYDQSGKEVSRAEFGVNFKRLRGWTCRLAPTTDPAHLAEREAVVWAFETYGTTSAGMGAIALGFRQRGITARNGTPVRISKVYHILKNPHYAGTLVVGKSRRGKFHHVGRDGEIEAVVAGSKEMAPCSPAIEIPNAHEALISPQLFEAVQARLRRNREKFRRRGSKNLYLLSGVLRCGTCGTKMHGHVTPNPDGNGGNLYYVCHGVFTRTGCTTFRGTELEAYVLRLLDALVTSQGAHRRIRDAIKRQLRTQPQTSAGTLRRSVEEFDRRIATARRRFAQADDDDVDAVKAILRELHEQKKQAEGALKETGVIRDSTSTTQAAAARALGSISDSIKGGDRRLAAEMIFEIFESITVFRRKIGNRCYFVKGRAVLRSSAGPLAPLKLHALVEALRAAPILQKLECTAAT